MADQKDDKNIFNETDFLQRENLNPDDFEKTELSNTSTKTNKSGLNNSTENWKKNQGKS